MEMSPNDLENKALFPQSALPVDLSTAPSFTLGRGTPPPGSGGVITSIEEEPLKCQDCSVSHAKRVLYKNLTAELSGSFLAEGGGWDPTSVRAKLDNHRKDSVPWENRFGAVLLTNYTHQVNDTPCAPVPLGAPPPQVPTSFVHTQPGYRTASSSDSLHAHLL